MMASNDDHSVARTKYTLNQGFQGTYFAKLKSIGDAVFGKVNDTPRSDNIFATCQLCKSCQGKEDEGLCKLCADAFTSGVHQVRYVVVSNTIGVIARNLTSNPLFLSAGRWPSQPHVLYLWGKAMEHLVRAGPT